MEDDEEEDEDDHIFKIDTNIDQYRLCKAKTAHDSVLGKIDASLAKKPLTITEAPHLDTKALLSKLDEVAKSVDLGVSTILAQQIRILFSAPYALGFANKSLLCLITWKSTIKRPNRILSGNRPTPHWNWRTMTLLLRTIGQIGRGKP